MPFAIYPSYEGEVAKGIYSSDLRRAISTACEIARERNIPQLFRQALREIHFGDWEGLSWQEIEQLQPEYAREWLATFPRMPAPNGETFAAFEVRVLDEVTHLIESNSKPIAIVTHAGVLRVVLRHLFGCSEEEAWQRTPPYCGLLRFDSNDKNPRLRQEKFL